MRRLEVGDILCRFKFMGHVADTFIVIDTRFAALLIAALLRSFGEVIRPDNEHILNFHQRPQSLIQPHVHRMKSSLTSTLLQILQIYVDSSLKTTIMTKTWRLVSKVDFLDVKSLLPPQLGFWTSNFHFLLHLFTSSPCLAPRLFLFYDQHWFPDFLPVTDSSCNGRSFNSVSKETDCSTVIDQPSLHTIY